LYAVIDIETTGGSALYEKITEIAIYLFDGQQITGEYVTLINPEKSIPPFITGLTGISDEMVKDAPKFYEVARDIVEITEGCIFVAHNVSFDYNFVRQEFRRLGYNYKRPVLCTVKLSRKLIPGFRSYSLGNLCSSLGITIEDRHRASGDAKATVKVLGKLLQVDPSLNGVPLNGLHPAFDKDIFASLPSTAGVYFFHDENGNILYIGKSRDLRSRVLSHISNINGSRAIELRGSIVGISYEETGSELIALLLESDEIKKHMPPYNRAQRRTLYKYGIYSFTSLGEYINLQIAKLTASGEPHYVFSSFEEASAFMVNLCHKYSLCQKLCGLYHNQGACFHHSVGQCQGACIGEELPEDYNERVLKAISSLKLPGENMLIIDRGRDDDERSAILVENGHYIGFGWFNPEYTENNLSAIRECIRPYTDNRDTQQIIRTHLKTKKIQKLIRF
jgi:DNA polymerase III subunit epsilon